MRAPLHLIADLEPVDTAWLLEHGPRIPKMDTPVERLLPHARPAVLLERIVANGVDWLAGVARVPRDSPFAGEDSAPIEATVEIAAQAAAAFAALGRGEPARTGFLVGIDELGCASDAIPLDAELEVRVRRTDHVGGLACFAFEVGVGGSPLATGTIRVLVPDA